MRMPAPNPHEPQTVQPSPSQLRGKGQIVTNRSLAGAAQQRLAQLLQSGPWAATRRQQAALLQDNPRTLAQTKCCQAVLGQPVQQRPAASSTFSGEQLPRVDEDDDTYQIKAAALVKAKSATRAVMAPNRTGLPDQLKTGVESLSGMTLDHVRVHYNSARPTQLNALAYAQGSNIHVAPGQERHLPHEAWHVVQQAQGRVPATGQLRGGPPINDDANLEREADQMGQKASSIQRVQEPALNANLLGPFGGGTIKTETKGSLPLVQLVLQFAALKADILNVAGENHDESGARRENEKMIASRQIGSDRYWTENQFTVAAASNVGADPPQLRYENILQDVLNLVERLEEIDKAKLPGFLADGGSDPLNPIVRAMESFQLKELESFAEQRDPYGPALRRGYRLTGLRAVVMYQCNVAKDRAKVLENQCKSSTGDTDYNMLENKIRRSPVLNVSLSEIVEAIREMHQELLATDVEFKLRHRNISQARSQAMHNTAQARAEEAGLWKVGNRHALDMKEMGPHTYNLLDKDEFNAVYDAALPK